MIERSSHDLLVLQTPRLGLRRLTLDDAAFILELLNEAAFLRFIGDRGVRNLFDAREYLARGPLLSYEQNGFGLWLVQLKLTGESLGLCGLIKRPALQDIDIGYAFLERFWSKGYAIESAQAVRNYALGELGLKRLVAITDPENTASVRLLEKIGLKFEEVVRLAENSQELKLFATNGKPPAAK